MQIMSLIRGCACVQHASRTRALAWSRDADRHERPTSGLPPHRSQIHTTHGQVHIACSQHASKDPASHAITLIPAALPALASR